MVNSERESLIEEIARQKADSEEIRLKLIDYYQQTALRMLESNRWRGVDGFDYLRTLMRKALLGRKGIDV